MELSMTHSVQINDGFTQTSADGVNMAFDHEYGIMFCVYMPGPQGHYGESRGRISLTFFPASQPTHTKTVDIASGHDEYVPNIISLGHGRVRILYEKDSRADEDHRICRRDFDFRSGAISDERTVMLKRDDGAFVPLTESEQFAYLERLGLCRHTRLDTEQISIGGHTIFSHGGALYGSITSYSAEPILYRSDDRMETVEFFAAVPYPAQYEMDYKILGGKLYALFRTDSETDSVRLTVSEDMGKTWSEPIALADSIQCRPRLIVYHGHILIAYNRYNPDTGNRPAVQQGRTEICLRLGEDHDPNNNRLIADLHSKYGIVNLCLCEILGDLYMAYSTSVLALEYQNGNEQVRGKDAIRYLYLGDLTASDWT